MNEHQELHPDSDDQFAQKLEQRHHELLDSSTSAIPQNSPNNLDEKRVEDAAAVLALLEKARQEQLQRQGIEETPAHPSTLKNTNSGDRGSSQFVAELNQIGRFEILEQIGSGGHGVVFRGHDPKLDRDVAIKVPKLESMLRPELQERFEREARAAAVLDHPNIVSVYENGQDQGILFLVCQFVKGQDLSTYLARGNKVTARQAAQMVSQLADGIEHAHQRGVLHRDLKPANVLLSQNSEQDKNEEAENEKVPFTPKVADFGLAAIVGDTQTGTLTGSLVGTPAYMAPEQAIGNRSQIGPPTDVYGLGTILYQTLTRVPPFTGGTVVETIRKISQDDPLPPTELDRSLPRDLSDICLKCLEKKPDMRYSSARELQADLQRFLDGFPVTARRITRFHRVTRWARRNPTLAITSVACVLLFFSALAATTIGWWSTTSALEREGLAKDQARQAIDEFYIDVVENDLLNVPGMTSVKQDLLSRALSYYQKIATVHGSDNLRQDVERAHFRSGRILSQLGQPKKALEQFESALELLSKQPANDQIELRRLGVLYQLSKTYEDLSDLELAMEYLDQSIEGNRVLKKRESNYQQVTSQLAKSLSRKAAMLKNSGDLANANTLIDESNELINEILSSEPNRSDYLRRKASGLNIKADTIIKMGQVDNAVGILNESIDLFRQTRQQNQRDPRVMHGLETALYSLARAHLMKREFEVALPKFKEAAVLASDLAFLFPDVAEYQVDRSTMLEGTAVCYASMNKPEEAAPAFKDNVTVLTQLVADYPDVYRYQIDLAGAKLNCAAAIGQANGSATEIQELLAGAIKAADAFLMKNPKDLQARILRSLAELNLAASYDQSDDFEKGLTHASNAVERLVELGQLAPGHPMIGPNIQMAYCTRAVALEELGRLEEAVEVWKQTSQMTGPRSQLETSTRLAAALACNDQADKALEILSSVDELQTFPNDHAGLFHLARARAALVQCWTRGDDADKEQIEQMATDTIRDLERAREVGKFRTVVSLEQDFDSSPFDTIKQRDDFKQWYATLKAKLQVDE